MTEAQRRATKAWQERHNLKRAELLVPASTLACLDEKAAEQGMSRTRFVLAALAAALGEPTVTGNDTRLASIEAKLDTLLNASKLEPPARYVTGDIPVDTKPKARAPDERLAALVRDYRPKGMPWGEIAKILNGRELLTPRGKPWAFNSIETYARRHRILED